MIPRHVDSRSGPAVLTAVHTLVTCDRIEVDRADGSSVAVRVDIIEQAPKDEFPSMAVHRPVPGPALRLVTCGGGVDTATGHHRDDDVVFASPVA